MDVLEMRKYSDNMYDVSDVRIGFNYWFNKLLNVCLQMFDYQNLPAGITKRELELNLMITGHAVVIAKSNGTYFYCRSR